MLRLLKTEFSFCRRSLYGSPWRLPHRVVSFRRWFSAAFIRSLGRVWQTTRHNWVMALAHSEDTRSTLSQWWLEMWSMRTSWPQQHSNIHEGFARQVGNACFNLSPCKLTLLWLQRTHKQGGFIITQVHKQVNVMTQDYFSLRIYPGCL